MRKNLTKSVSFFLCFAIIIGLIILILAVACSDDNPASSDLPQLLLSPAAISLTADQGQGNSSYTLVRVYSDPRSEVGFSFSCDASWITLSNLAGTKYGITTDSFSVSYSVGSLPVGTYCDSIVVTSSGASNSPAYIEVEYTITPIEPMLTVRPFEILNTLSTPADPISPDTIRISSADGGHYAYTLSKTSDWLTLSKTSGTTPDTVVMNVDLDATVWGGHVDTIWVNAADLPNSPQTVVCSLYINPWQAQASPMPHILYDIDIISDQHAWAVGTALGYMGGGWTGWAIYTENGGLLWNLGFLINADEDEYFGLSSLDRFGDHIWTVGQNGVIRYSPDLGQTWSPQSTGLADTTVDLLDVKFVSQQVGWIVGHDGLILATTDGGSSWTQQASGTSTGLRGCCFIDPLTGWAAGDNGKLLRTTDGGITWTPGTGPGGQYKDIYFVNSNIGWAVGDGGLISHTDDGGVNWTAQQSNTDKRLNSVFFIDNFVGWVSGGDGTVLYTDDAGSTWTAQYTTSVKDLYQVLFLDALRGWVVGADGEIRYTNCGGN